MKTSAILALTGSLLAMASPINKRAYETHVVTDIVVVTVTVEPWTTTSYVTAAATTSTSTTTSTSSTRATTTKKSHRTRTSSSSVAPTTTSTSSTEVPSTTSTSTSSSAAPTVTEEAAVIAAVSSTTSSSSTSTSSTTSSTSAAATDDFSTAAVYHHNIHRANHSAPDASWNSDLASYAATVAASCVFAHDLTVGSDTGSYGQNIAMYGSSGDISDTPTSSVIAQAITDMWYNGEVNLFPSDGYGEDTPDMTNFDSWGHFSQVVWVESTEVGCAVQFCAAGTMLSSMDAFYSVCNYRSTGNVGGSYGANVLPSLGEATVSV